MCLFSYLDQLKREAKAAGVDLGDACGRAGIAATTLQRWLKGDVTPRKATAEAVLEKIREIAAEPRVADADPAPQASAA